MEQLFGLLLLLAIWSIPGFSNAANQEGIANGGLEILLGHVQNSTASTLLLPECGLLSDGNLEQLHKRSAAPMQYSMGAVPKGDNCNRVVVASTMAGIGMQIGKHIHYILSS